MDINAFRNRIKMKQDELAEKLGLATGSVGNLCSGKKRPSYEVIEKMFLLGARLDEVFSKEVQDAILKNYAAEALPAVPPGCDTPEFREGVLMALADLQRKGYIKDIGVKEKDG